MTKGRADAVAPYVALLRGVNVAGKRVGMEALRAGLAALGLADVRTYLQSGNVVFAADQSDTQALAAAIRGRVAADFGHDVQVLVLTTAEMRRVAEANPFVIESAGGVDQAWLHATLLFAPPLDESTFGGLDLPAAEGERAVLAGRVVYLYLPHGYGRTKLHNAYFERVFGAATTRNWRTILALAAMVAGE